MSVLELLNEFMEEARTLQNPYTIEKQLTGSIVVWNIPDTLTDLLQTAVQNAVKEENVDAIRKLVSSNVHPDDAVYKLAVQIGKAGANAPNRSNIRFHMSYAGPKLEKRVGGILTTKDQTSQWLHRTVKSQVDRAKLIVEQTPSKVEKPINVVHQSRFVKFIGKHTSHEMVFAMIPNKKEYGKTAIKEMPLTIENIVITPVQIAGERATYRMNAAGKPWLVKIGNYLDARIKAEHR